MTKQHPFIFYDGQWEGEGVIELSMLPGQLKFYTQWTVYGSKNQPMTSATQTIEVEGKKEKSLNRLLFSPKSSENFEIHLDNVEFGTIHGSGVYDPNKIAWEFRNKNGVEGYEAYWKDIDGRYSMKAEFLSEQIRTKITGKIWQK